MRSSKAKNGNSVVTYILKKAGKYRIAKYEDFAPLMIKVNNNNGSKQ